MVTFEGRRNRPERQPRRGILFSPSVCAFLSLVFIWLFLLLEILKAEKGRSHSAWFDDFLPV